MVTAAPFRITDPFGAEWVPTGQLRLVPLAELPPRVSLSTLGLDALRLQQEFRCIDKRCDNMWRDVPIRKE